jgi:hypothetical protein
MRYFILLLISSIYLISCGVNSSDFSAYPKLKTVAEWMDKEYKVRESAAVSFTLAKKPGGWFLVKLNKENAKPIAEELVWSSSSKSYVKIPEDFLNSPVSTAERVQLVREMRGRDYSFDHSVYFGYEGWEDDAIKALDGGGLNDTLTEALARAYAAKCIMVSRPEKTATVERSKKLSDAQVNDFCSYGDKTIETYKKLLEMNPDYETIVGKAQTKLSNEYVFLWSELKQAGREKEAAQFLPEGLYDDLMINFAKNMLNGAERNAIVFCNGDNDTYPLWYVQQKLGVRKDIAVMNTSLMNIPSWVFNDKKTYGFDMKISEQLYFDSLSDVIYIDRSTGRELSSSGSLSDKIIDMTHLKNGVEEKDPSYSMDLPSGDAALRLSTGNIRLSYLRDDSLAPVVHLNSSYLFKSDLALLDILASNLGKRTIYFAQTAIYGSIPEALKRNFLREGLLVRVIQGENKGLLSGNDYFDIELFYANHTSRFNFGCDKLKSLQVETIADNYVYNFSYLCIALLENGDTARAINAAEVCVNKIPFRLFTDAVGPYLIGDNFCRAGKKEEGRKLFAMAIDKIKMTYIDETENYKLMQTRSILERILETSENNNFRELISSATALKQKVDDKMQKQGGEEKLRYNTY